jgi:hypothetical protein
MACSRSTRITSQPSHTMAPLLLIYVLKAQPGTLLLLQTLRRAARTTATAVAATLHRTHTNNVEDGAVPRNTRERAISLAF